MVFRHIERFASGLKAHSHRKTLPVGFSRPPTLAEQVARLVRSQQMADFAAAQGLESFEEADDFDIPDDPVDPTTPYEADFDLAAVKSSDYGLTASPATPDAYQAKERVKEAKNSKRRGSSAPEVPHVSKGDEEPLLSPDNA